MIRRYMSAFFMAELLNNRLIGCDFIVELILI